MPGRKRRKVKQPENLLMRDAETLHMRFRTNFRLERDEMFISLVLMTLISTAITGLFASVARISLPVTLVAGGISAILYYLLVVRLYNQTHIDMDENEIRISRKPIPTLFSPTHTVNLADVVGIRCAETEASMKEGFDTPRFRVWAEREDGGKRTIVNDVTEPYAYFITQCLDARLHEDAEAWDDEAVDSAEDEAGSGELVVEAKGARLRR